MSVTWPSGLEAGDFLAGGGIYNLGQILWDRDICATQKNTSALFPSTTYTNSTPLLGRVDMTLPSFMISGTSIGWMFQPYISGTILSGVMPGFFIRLVNASDGVVLGTSEYVPIYHSGTSGEWLDPIEVIYNVRGDEVDPPRPVTYLESIQDGEMLRINYPFVNPSGWPMPSATSVTGEFLFRLDANFPDSPTTMFGQGAGSVWTMRVYYISGKMRTAQENTFYDGSISTQLTSVDARDGRWHHYAFTIQDNPRELRHWLDGVFMGASSTGTAWDMKVPYPYGPAPGQGITDNINFGWDNATTHYSGWSVAGLLLRTGLQYTGNFPFAAPTEELIPSGTIGSVSGVIMYLPMTEGTGQYLYDLGPSGYHGVRGHTDADNGLGIDIQWASGTESLGLTIGGTRVFIDLYGACQTGPRAGARTSDIGANFTYGYLDAERISTSGRF